MDDLIAFGAAGICLLFVTVALIGYGAFILIITAAHALASGDFVFFLVLVAAACAVFSLYAGTGILLQKSGWI